MNTNLAHQDMSDTKVRTLRSLPTTASIEEILSVFNEDGGLIIKGFLNADEIKSFNADIETAMESLNPGGGVSEEHDMLLGKNTKRLTNSVERSPTLRQKILDKDLMHQVGDGVFGEKGTYWLAAAQVIEIGPQNVAQLLHRDLEAWPIFYRMGAEAPDVIVNFIVALTEFTEENGATRIIPGSHKWDFADRGTPEQTIPVEMDAGDVVIFSGKVVHGGGHNQTNSFYRRGLSIPLLVGYLTPEEAIPMTTSLESARGLPERVQRLIGYRSQRNYESAVDLWHVQYKDVGDSLGL